MSTSRTKAYANYQVNYERLKQFTDFSKFFDIDAEPVRTSRQEDFMQSSILPLLKERVLVARPNLASDLAALSAEIAKLEQEFGELMWQEKLSSYHRMRNELIVVQSVIIAEVYLSELLKLVFFNNTNLIWAKQDEPGTMKYNEILAYSSIDDLKEAIVERRIQQVMKKYVKGMVDFIHQCCPKQSVPIGISDLHVLERLWDTRNLIVHQSCIADEMYAAKYSVDKGHLVTVDEPFIQQHDSILQSVLAQIDANACGIKDIPVT